MKKLALITAVIAVVTLLSGCVLISVAPFYAPADTLFDSALVGEWADADSPDEQWKFERAGERTYKLTRSQKNSDSVISQVHLFKLRDQLFLDLSQSPDASDDSVFPPRIPSHLLVRVYQLKPTFRAATMNY